MSATPERKLICEHEITGDCRAGGYHETRLHPDGHMTCLKCDCEWEFVPFVETATHTESEAQFLKACDRVFGPAKPSNKPTWTATPPTEPGFYWMRRVYPSRYGDAFIERVTIYGDVACYCSYDAMLEPGFTYEFWPVRIQEPPK